MTRDPVDQPADEPEKEEVSTGEHPIPSHVGPGGPAFDPNVQPQTGTPVEEEDEVLPLDDPE